MRNLKQTRDLVYSLFGTIYDLTHIDIIQVGVKNAAVWKQVSPDLRSIQSWNAALEILESGEHFPNIRTLKDLQSYRVEAQGYPE